MVDRTDGDEVRQREERQDVLDDFCGQCQERRRRVHGSAQCVPAAVEMAHVKADLLIREQFRAAQWQDALHYKSSRPLLPRPARLKSSAPVTLLDPIRKPQIQHQSMCPGTWYRSVWLDCPRQRFAVPPSKLRLAAGGLDPNGG